MSTISASTTTTTAYKVTADTTGTLVLQTGATPTTAATFDASQNMGLGVTPSAWSGAKALQLNSNLGIYGAGTAEFGAVSNTYYNGTNWIYGATAVAAKYAISAGQHQWFNAPSGTAGTTATFTQAMTLDASGYLRQSTNGTTNGGTFNEFNTAASSWISLFFNRAASAPSGIQIQYTAVDPNGTGNEFLFCSAASVTRASIRSNGGIANYSANNVNLSDRREKINFAPAGEYLAKICAIPVQTFNYIDQNLEEDGGLTLGVVAQDVQEIAPELVLESNWGTKEEPKMRLSIYQTDLQYALMKCIQELKADLDATKAELAALKGAA